MYPPGRHQRTLIVRKVPPQKGGAEQVPRAVRVVLREGYVKDRNGIEPRLARSAETMAPIKDYTCADFQWALYTLLANVLEESRVLAGPQFRNELRVRVEAQLIEQDEPNNSASAAAFAIVVARSSGSSVCRLLPRSTSVAVASTSNFQRGRRKRPKGLRNSTAPVT